MNAKPAGQLARVLGIRSWRAAVGSVIVAGLTAIGCTPTPPPTAPKAPEVDVVQPVQESVTDYAVFTGNVQAEKSVNLVAQVTGYLLPEPMPKEGTDVAKDATALPIDPRVYQATLDQAKARPARAPRTSTSGTWPRPSARRPRPPCRTSTRLREAQAAEKSAQLNVGFTAIDAPFDGRISRRNVDPGNLVTANVTVLASIVQLDPIYAYFDVDERTLLRIHKLVDAGMIPPESIKGKYLGQPRAVRRAGLHVHRRRREKDTNRRKSYSAADLQATPAASQDRPRHPGHIVIVDNQENVQTGTLRMWGEFPNPVALGGRG